MVVGLTDSVTPLAKLPLIVPDMNYSPIVPPPDSSVPTSTSQALCGGRHRSCRPR
jgi:hypothetical protein